MIYYILFTVYLHIDVYIYTYTYGWGYVVSGSTSLSAEVRLEVEMRAENGPPMPQDPKLNWGVPLEGILGLLERELGTDIRQAL